MIICKEFVSKEKVDGLFGSYERAKYRIYRSSPKPFRLYYSITELSVAVSKKKLSQYFEDNTHHTEYSVFFLCEGDIYSLDDFITVGMPMLRSTKGDRIGLASGEFLIGATSDGKIYSFSSSEEWEKV